MSLQVVCIDGTVILLLPDPTPPWSFVSAPYTVTITGNADKTKISSKNAVLWNDAYNQINSLVDIPYITPTHIVPGKLALIELSPLQESEFLKNSGDGVFLNSYSGTFEATVTKPAETPPSASIPDPDIPTKTGTWSVQSHGQGDTPILQVSK